MLKSIGVKPPACGRPGLKAVLRDGPQGAEFCLVEFNQGRERIVVVLQWRQLIGLVRSFFGFLARRAVSGMQECKKAIPPGEEFYAL